MVQFNARYSSVIAFIFFRAAKAIHKGLSAANDHIRAITMGKPSIIHT